MSAPVEQPTVDETGEERHPAWGLLGASRVSSSPPGASLFDSDIRHSHHVVVRLKHASRQRKLNSDWLHGERPDIVEVEMSEAQWASFVSTMNTGDGVPCTITWLGAERVPGVPHAPRMEQSMREVRDAGEHVIADVRKAFATYEDRPIKANLRSLAAAIENLPGNMEFAAKSLTEHAENVVQKARADIEAMVLAKADQIGLDRGHVTEVAQLGEGS